MVNKIGNNSDRFSIVENPDIKYPIVETVLKFHTDSLIDNHRYKSWEHCFNAFGNSSDIDYLSLNLAFYLASWGMMRASSGLLQKDYKIHYPVVEILLDSSYDPIRFCYERELNKKHLSLIVDVGNRIKKYYESIEFRDGKNRLKTITPTDTLITKVLLGTLGCVPAYDRYVISGFKKMGIKPVTFNNNSLESLLCFIERNEPEFKSVQSLVNNSGCKYPLTKIVDMYFWQIGYY
jgi:hypothetical protein